MVPAAMQIEDNSLGSAPAERILNELRPAYWFSAHLHVKYAALVSHKQPLPEQPSSRQQPSAQPQQQQVRVFLHMHVA